MKNKSLVLVILFLSNCYFAVDWSKGSTPKASERAVLQDVPAVDEANLSKAELARKGKKPNFKTKEEQELFQLMTEQGRSPYDAHNCTTLYSDCKDKCWKEYPSPVVETVITAITTNRKRENCIAQCRNVCDNFDPSSSSGPMPNSGKGNYSNPNAPRY
ncbi:hypothetical protein EHQ53_12150 [Leptospira langatensis]|uniref:Lipoprotein n=1 Tax=Leptospira langatensis TaxID=2484983 RepID=A0A5F1ZS25_9LEPT|nr:hypothetical protein [Leptospira langatensis]TGJ98707.1 hypothetical protein EHO57_14355 [Leptospira langatensis]TGL40727.1 hypothetical protein EHQ53_12150 [Leptospira langatensis]